VVLEVRRIGKDAGTTTQFTQFEPNSAEADTLFAWLKPAPSGRENGAALADAAGWPTTLPGGYALLSADAFEASGQRIRQSRYSDGLSILSVFVTSAPVEAPAAAAAGRSPLDLSGPDRVKQWRAGGRYYTAIGDVPPPLLSEIQQKIE
jgi:negative regulator of sigma E activity